MVHMHTCSQVHVEDAMLRQYGAAIQGCAWKLRLVTISLRGRASFVGSIRFGDFGASLLHSDFVLGRLCFMPFLAKSPLMILLAALRFLIILAGCHLHVKEFDF